MQAFVHMADLGHCCRKWNLHKRGVVALETESFAQGDEERKRGVPIMPMMNRHQDSYATGQGFFLGTMVKPLLTCCTEWISPEVGASLRDNLESNDKEWAKLVDKF